MFSQIQHSTVNHDMQWVHLQNKNTWHLRWKQLRDELYSYFIVISQHTLSYNIYPSLPSPDMLPNHFRITSFPHAHFQLLQINDCIAQIQIFIRVVPSALFGITSISSQIKVDQNSKTCRFGIVQPVTLTGLHELTLTPEHLGERASAAGEHLLHGCAPPRVERSSVFRTRVHPGSVGVWRRLSVAPEQPSHRLCALEATPWLLPR